MQKFLFLYRSAMPESEPSPEEMQKSMEAWTTWLMDGKEKGLVVALGDALAPTGSVMRSGAITDGPYMESKEVCGGYSIIQADSIETAQEYAKDCPALTNNGSVEIRPLLGVGDQMQQS